MKKDTLTVETDEHGTTTYCNADGDFHNPHGPAVIYADGSKTYWINDQLHNSDGPAIVHADGSIEYWINDQLHNSDGPAIVYVDGHKEHYIKGKPHNPDGPAIVYADGHREYWINGERLTEAEFKAWQSKQSAPLHNKTATIDGIEYTLTAK